MRYGFSVEDLSSTFPEKMALIGEHAVNTLDKGHRLATSTHATLLTPYYYIGREQLSQEIDIFRSLLTIHVSKNKESDEEE